MNDLVRRIHVLCTGNICRSPMAEGLFRAQVGIVTRGIAVESSGLEAETGSAPEPEAVRALAERGIDIAGHRSRRTAYADLRGSELILVMERWQERRIRARWPTLAGRVFLLGHWDGTEVPDPYGGGIEAFRQTLGLIERGVESWISRLGA